MNIQTVRAKGFIGVKDGMGLDELFVDFSHMTGLIGITGPTGMGKSTLLELAQPYPYMVSRTGALSRHVFLKDSSKEVTFLHNGDHFRNLIKVNAESGKSEGYVYVNQEGSDNPVSLTSTISEYKAFMDKTFGSFKLFSSSAFFAQNSDGPTSLATADLRGIFREVMGDKLQTLEGYSGTSKSAVRILDGKLSLVDQDIERQGDIIQVHAHASGSLAAALIEEASTETLGAQAHEDLSVIRKDMELLKKLSLQRDVDQETKTSLGDQMESLEKEAAEIRTALASYNQDYAQAIAISEKNIQEYRELLKGKEDIEGASDQVTKLTERADALMLERSRVSIERDECREEFGKKDREDREIEAAYADVLEASRERYQVVKAAVDGTKAAVISLSSKLESKKDRLAIRLLESDRDRCIEMMADLGKRGSVTDTDGDYLPCNSTDCVFIEKALAAQTRLPALTQAVLDAESENSDGIKFLEISISDAEKEGVEFLADLERLAVEGGAQVETHKTEKNGRWVELDGLEKRMAAGAEHISGIDAKGVEINALIKYHTDLAAKLPEIKVAEANIASLKAAAETLRVDGEEHTKADNTRIEVKCAQIDGIQQRIDDIDKLTDPDLDAKVHKESVNIRLKEGLIVDFQEQIKQLDVKIALLRENVTTADAAAKATEELTERRKMLSEEHTGHVYLQNKTGPRGIQALIIDAVAPQIKDDANMLLSSAFGPGAIVDWDTLDENGKEILEPMVINAEGVKVPLDFRSGGQKQLARRAIACGMAILANNEAGFGYDTAFFDEKDEGLDQEAAINFTRMFGAFLEYGKFEKGLFVSHKPGCVDVADHVIELGKGGIQ